MFKSIKKITIALVISILLFNASSLAYYTDIESDSPYYYGVEYLRQNNVFSDFKILKPDTIISRAEFIKYLVLINNKNFEKSKNIQLPFQDTTNNSWYAPYFQEAIKLGILNSKDKNVYPYKDLMVVEAVELLFNSKSIPIPTKHVGPISYKDVKNSEEYQAMMMRAEDLDIIAPERKEYYGMYKKVSKALAANMIYNMDTVNVKSPSTSSDSTTAPSSSDVSLQKIITSWQLINSDFIDSAKLDKTKLSNSAIKALVDELDDPHSVYMDVVTNEAFTDSLDGNFEGIGAYVEMSEKGDVTIVSPIKNSPAEKAGILAGDIIRKVGDYDTKGKTLNEIVAKIKGKSGTKVKLTIERNSTNTIVIEVTRGAISIESLEYKIVGTNKDIMYMSITSFNQSASNGLKDLVPIITKDPKIKGIIIDLRNNPGGLLSAATNMLQYLLPEGSVAVQMKYSYYNISQKTVRDGVLKNYPMAVLVNKGSASASEIVAGALQDYKVAKIIGETTYGKGTVQQVNYFTDNSSLKLTIAKWLTSKGNSINGIGITPDIEIKKATGSTIDNQLERAITEVSKSIK